MNQGPGFIHLRKLSPAQIFHVPKCSFIDQPHLFLFHWNNRTHFSSRLHDFSMFRAI